ncbi:MAG: hypothetical protein D4S01_11495 [Dehalococcoidia bacterium]|nr:MAG: hypothetical protein D4S01_11495 [Dehalococcoidia bacterium]
MKQAKLKTNINNWLSNIIENGVDNVNPDKVFINYKPLDAGNVKLDKGILSFNLLPVVTCGGKQCVNCYDVKSLRHTSVREKRYVNTSMAMHNTKRLKALILKQVQNSKTIKFLRIHVGGDMFSKEYVNMWKEIAKEVAVIKPHVKIYTYTKTGYGKELTKAGINVVRSLYPEGYNYGDMEYIVDMKKKYGGSICPATLHKSGAQICGTKCQKCMLNEVVFFKIH